MIKGNDFGWALKQLRDNKVVQRRGVHTYIFLITGRVIEYNTFVSFKNNANQLFNPPKDIVIKDHIDAKVNGEYITGWIPSQEDLLANDWIVSNK